MKFDSYIDQHGKYLQSMPVNVNLAGFKSTTTELQKNGWQLSVEAFRMFDRASSQIRMAFKHDGIKQVALGYMNLDDRMFYAVTSSHHEMMSFWRSMRIDICVIAPVIRFQVMPTMGLPSFSAIDACPQYGTVEKDLNDIALFKPVKAGEDFEIYIHKKDESEILEMLLKKQDLKQKEIKQNEKRRAYLQSSEGSEMSDLTLDDKVNSDIRAQLMLVG